MDRRERVEIELDLEHDRGQIVLECGRMGVRLPGTDVILWRERDESESWFLHRIQQMVEGLRWVGETDGRMIPGGWL